MNTTTIKPTTTISPTINVETSKTTKTNNTTTVTPIMYTTKTNKITTTPISIPGLSSYNLIKSQNAQLSNMITNSSNENNKHNQKSIYQQGDIALLNTINNYLLVFYYLILVALVYFIYFDKEYSIFKKILILALFASYPYLANLIKYYVVKFFLYVYSIININVYESGEW